MKTIEEIAVEMVPEPRADGKWRTHIVEPGEDGDWVPLEPQRDRLDADCLVADARGIIARLVERVRAEQTKDRAGLAHGLGLYRAWFAAYSKGQFSTEVEAARLEVEAWEREFGITFC